MALTTTVGGVWTLQALLGVETMPAVLRIKPYVPSVHDSLIVRRRPVNCRCRKPGSIWVWLPPG
jgi:hypothetical protein